MRAARKPRITIPTRTALAMAGGYLRRKTATQLRAVAFIIVYLVLFRVLFLDGSTDDFLPLAAGIGLLVIGLTFFLEGLFLGLMPLGEKVGIKLPARAGLGAILVFSVLLGAGATLAEPAIAGLRDAGANTAPWENPLLYAILERHPGLLIAAIGIGVGIAVALGILRFYHALSLKPFVYAIIPLLLAATAFFAGNPDLAAILGLAWDAGAITTGVVTVPLVLALGIGVSRAAGATPGIGNGFGVIMLASAVPIMAVMVLGMLLLPQVPHASTEEAFFAATNRKAAVSFLGDETILRDLAFRRGGPAARLAFYGSAPARDEALVVLARQPAVFLGTIPLAEWTAQRASDEERRIIQALTTAPQAAPKPVGGIVGEETVLAIRAILPLTALLAVVLYLLLRSRPRHQDEVGLGIGLACLGMILLTSGIRFGLAPLGDSIGRELPPLIHAEHARFIYVEGFDTNSLLGGIGSDGAPARFVAYQDGQGARLLPFIPEDHDPERRTYRIPLATRSSFGLDLPAFGVVLVLVFAFGLGYGSTLAEPALYAMGRTVERLSVGTVRASGIIRAVSLGVGLGLAVGVGRILFGWPLAWILIAVYLLLLILTGFSEEDFVGIAWDSGGVTTGPVTVPLVLALGLGIGREAGIPDAFGILAMASAFPIMTVLVYGLLIRLRQRNLIRAGAAEENDA